MSEENKNNAALTRHSSNGLMRVENVMGITQKILNKMSVRGFQFNYKTTEIDGVIYLAENLRETHFRNGDPITEAKTDEHWKYCAENGIPAFCHYDNDPKNNYIFGKLYNSFCITDERGLVPNGWQVINKLLDERVNPYKTDLMSFIHWPSLNEKVFNNILDGKQFNTKGFNAIPSGMRNHLGVFSGFGTEFNVWKVPDSSTNSYIRRCEDGFGQYGTIRLGIYLAGGMRRLNSGIELGCGLAVRCMKST